MAKINPYLNFHGNAEEAFNFYKSVFGGEFAMVMRYRDFPSGEECEGMTIPENALDKLMHIALPVGDGNVLMASDVLDTMKDKFVKGDNFSISISAESREEADRLFKGLSEGGQVTMPLADAFWGDYFGMCVDRFGVQWMFSFRENNK